MAISQRVKFGKVEKEKADSCYSPVKVSTKNCN